MSLTARGPAERRHGLVAGLLFAAAIVAAHVWSSDVSGQEDMSTATLDETARWLLRFTSDQPPMQFGSDELRGRMTLGVDCALVIERESVRDGSWQTRVSYRHELMIAAITSVSSRSLSRGTVEITTRHDDIRTTETARPREEGWYDERGGYHPGSVGMEITRRLDRSCWLEMRPAAGDRVVRALEHARRLCGTTGADPF